jgi:hypothetical protein
MECKADLIAREKARQDWTVTLIPPEVVLSPHDVHPPFADVTWEDFAGKARRILCGLSFL